MELIELFGELRSLLETPSKSTWWEIGDLLDRFEHDDQLEEVISSYLASRLEQGWPDTIARPALEHWYDDEVTPTRRRALSALARIHCPGCQSLCEEAQVRDAVKILHGKNYTRVVRVRDLMTQRVQQDWRCAHCRAQIACPHCEEEKTFKEVIQAIVLFHGKEKSPRLLARAILDGRNNSMWVCVACHDRGVKPEAITSASTASTSAAPARNPRTRAQHQGPYQTISRPCKECRADFIFTAEEQRIWYEQYGIPLHAPGMWGPGDRIVRVRCDDCQRRHIAQKRIGQLLARFDEDDPRQHLTLARHYDALDNEQKANMHRNRARKLEER